MRLPRDDGGDSVCHAGSNSASLFNYCFASHRDLSRLYQQTSQPSIPTLSTRSPFENWFLRSDSRIAGRRGDANMRIALTDLFALNVDSTANDNRSSSIFALLYASSAKNLRTVAMLVVPFCSSASFSRSLDISLVIGSSLGSLREASSPIIPRI